MQSVKIIGLAILASILYGVLHDLVTTRICIEYFTIGHPPVFDTDSPTLLALGWGIAATWWVGLFLGIAFALAARLGGWPRRSASSLIRPIVTLLLICGFSAAVAGLLGRYLAARGLVFLVEPMASRIPPGRHIPFLANLWAHWASYIAGFLGAIVLVVSILKNRFRAALCQVATFDASSVPNEARLLD